MKIWGVIFAVGGFLAVALGAFAAHGLKNHLDEKYLTIFQTGVTYQFYHALAIGLVVVLMRQETVVSFVLNRAAGFFSLGMLLFSGSLYALALTRVGMLGAITPLGGVSFLIGWGHLIWYFIKK